MLIVLLISIVQQTTCQPTIIDYNNEKMDTCYQTDARDCDCRQVAVEMNMMKNLVSDLSEASRLLSYQLNVSIAAIEHLHNVVAKQPVSVRLAGGSLASEGRLEVLYNDVWGTVCDDNFDNNDAAVACYMLGFGHIGVMRSNTFGPGTGQIWLDEVGCVGSESSIAVCAHNVWGSHDCQHSEDVSISCNTGTVAVRLAGGSLVSQGRLEVFYNDTWGTVCDDQFDHNDAAVACYMLGFGRSGVMRSNIYGPGTGQIWLDDVGCVGSESSIAVCAHNVWGSHNCGHGEDVSISCHAGCPTGFIWSPTVNRCYKLITEKTNWTTAAVRCRSLHHKAHLVTINSVAQQMAVNRIVASYNNSTLQELCGFEGLSDRAWNDSLFVGGQRVNPSTNSEFVWRILRADSNTYTVSALNYTNWNSGEPNFHNPEESCMTIVQRFNYQWNDNRCGYQLCSLCQVEMP